MKTKEIVADEPVSRIPRPLPCYQQLPQNQQIPSVNSVSFIRVGRNRCTIFAHFQHTEGKRCHLRQGPQNEKPKEVGT